MAPPLVKGSALVRRRIAGVIFLLVVALLVDLAVALYQKKFTAVAAVTLETDRAGNQLSLHADVKLRGVVVGEVRTIASKGDHATITLALKPGKLSSIPKNVSAQLLPKTLFGEKEVALIVPADPSPETLAAGDTIPQDRSSTALETETALNDLLPLLRSLKPEQLSVTLNALSEALRGRGDQLGKNFALNGAYFAKLNPSLPRLGQDMAGLADFANNYADATPDLLKVLDNFSASSRDLVEEKPSLGAFLSSTKAFAASATDFVTTNEPNLVALARDSGPPLRLFATYSDTYACMFKTLAFQEIEGERVFGGLQPGLHITIEPTRDNGNYVPGDEPKYKDSYDPHCYGLVGKPIIPFPAYRQPQDGYHDNAPPDDPGTGPGHSSPSFLAPIVRTPAVALTPVLPKGTSPLDALLIDPLLVHS